MRRLLSTFGFALCLTLIAASAALAQTPYTSPDGEYMLELPSATWRVTTQAQGDHQHAEFIYGDRNDGFLQIRKEVVTAETTASDMVQRDQDRTLQFRPGYVAGKEEKFAGRLSGVTFSYEYTQGGKPMAARVYYLQANNRTFYILRFTALRDKLGAIRNQTDNIARSFRLN